MRVIGFMSGTSLDGVDAALIETDGVRVTGFGPALTMPYPATLRATLRDLLTRIAARGEIGPLPGLAEAEAALTDLHIEAAAALGPPGDLIGFHGQTVLHAPARGITWQIGDAARLARATRTPVACDFRLADVAAGGQGAPLVPIFHAALAEALEKPLLIVNIGGIANLTWIGADGTLLACDTGPGNALLDDFMQARTGLAMDADGACARAGRPDAACLAALLADEYFTRAAPKSLDRLDFAQALDSVAGLSTADGAATLAAFTARAIAASALPAPPRRVLVGGGGRHNRAIMLALAAAMDAPVAPVDEVGWNGDALEAQCFAFLAARVQRGLPLSFPGTTGAPHPLPGGRMVLP